MIVHICQHKKKKTSFSLPSVLSSFAIIVFEKREPGSRMGAFI